MADTRPALGPLAESGFALARTIDRTQLSEVIERRERYARRFKYEKLNVIADAAATHATRNPGASVLEKLLK